MLINCLCFRALQLRSLGPPLKPGQEAPPVNPNISADDLDTCGINANIPVTSR